MTYLLDTNAVSDLMRSVPRIENWLANLDADDLVVTCPIVRGEVLFGVHRVPTGRRRAELEATAHRFLSTFICEPIPELAGDHYAALKRSRQRQGLVIDENDLWIAAMALALGAVLVSRDRDFAEIPGLSVLALT